VEKAPSKILMEIQTFLEKTKFSFQTYMNSTISIF
jgi:hypothetical protein